MIITDSDLLTIKKLIKIPTILFSDHEIIYLNQASQKLELTLEHLHSKAVDYVNLQEFQCMMMVKLRCGGNIYTRMTGEWVTYREQAYVFAQFYDFSYSKELLTKIERLSKARGLMLEISLSIGKITEIEVIYDLILKNVMRTVEKSSLATIFRLEDGEFHVVAQSGYADEVKDLRIPMEESFLYLATDGKMDHTTVIDDLTEYVANYHPIKIVKNASDKIQSTLIAPLHVDHELFGMICVDSSEKNAFSSEDLEIMEYVKNNIDLVLSNRWYLEKIDYMANHDPLTGLMNRAGLLSYLEQTMKIWMEDHVFLVVFDVNNLKYMNDTYGHLWGDRVIREIAGALSALTTREGVVARFGGDEFLGVFFHDKQELLCKNIEEVQRKLSNNTYQIHGEKVEISFSYGMACYGKDAKEVNRLISIADKRMYEYKKGIKEEEKFING